MTGLERLVEAFDPVGREEGVGSVYYRAMNMTQGVLVANQEDSVEIMTECLEAGFPVALELREESPYDPRIETPSESVIGRSAISGFLADVERAGSV